MADIMTDHLGTLAGLIADLEELTPPEGTFDGMYDWYTRVGEIVRKHKRAMYDIESFPFDLNSGHRHRVVNLDPFVKPDEYVVFEGTVAECEAWIDRQVNGDA